MKQILLSIAVVAMICGTASSAQLVIVENGQPRATIVVAADEPKAERAATEIQKYVGKMSGATLEIRTEPAHFAGEWGIAIFVGHTRQAKSLGVKIPSGYDRTVRPDFNERSEE